MSHTDELMRSDAVLIIGGRASKELLDALSGAGLTAVLKRSLRAALAEVRHRAHRAVVINDSDPEQDILEMVLNIRDFDERVPVVILRTSGRTGKTNGLLQDLGVQALSASSEPQAIVRCVLSAIASR